MLGAPPQALEKRVCLRVRSAPFGAVLAALLEEWHYTVLDAPDDADLVLTEEGVELPEVSCPVLWLTRSRYGERNRLSLPLSLEELWADIEHRFHRPPRGHIRAALKVPAVMEVRGEEVAVVVASLSDLGVRLEVPLELVQGETLQLHLDLGGTLLAPEGRVIYVIPDGDLDGSARTRVGVIFECLPSVQREALRGFVVRTYLERVRARLDASTFRQGLAHFTVPVAVLTEVGF